MTTLWQDVLYGLRILAEKPGFTAIAVIFRDPRLVVIRTTPPDIRNRSTARWYPITWPGRTQPQF